METWKDIPGYEGLYQVSNFGRAKSLDRNIIAGGAILQRTIKERILKQGVNQKGYKCFGISKEGKVKSVRTHQIVAKLFIENPLNLPEVNHKDENKENNSSDNLEWCTHLYNIRYGTGIARKTKSQTGISNLKNSGEGGSASKLKEHQVLSIYSDSRKYKEIAKEYNINISAISKIKHKTTWRVLLESI